MDKSIYDKLNLIKEKHLTTLSHGQIYQRRLKKAFDKKVRPPIFQEGDLMLKKYSLIHSYLWGKWTPNYEWPFIVKKVF